MPGSSQKWQEGIGVALTLAQHVLRGATVGTAGVELAQEVLAEAQGAVLPLVPYLDTLRWLFIALALGGIALAVWAPQPPSMRQGHQCPASFRFILLNG